MRWSKIKYLELTMNGNYKPHVKLYSIVIFII